jgi:hypothetical protein
METTESKIKRLERDLEQPISAACRAETMRVLELLRAQIAEEKKITSEPSLYDFAP